MRWPPAGLTRRALPDDADRRGLPPLFRGRRRRYLALLIGAGLGQALSGAAVVLAIKRILHSSAGVSTALPLVVLFAASVTIGVLRMAERSWAEKLSQHYVHELRGQLLGAALEGTRRRSLGVTVARTTNDLSAIRNWMALGVAPLAAGVPLLVGAVVVLVVIDPLLAAAASAPLVLLAGLFVAVAPVAYERSRRQRRVRGRLASQIADTVVATVAIRAAGGQARELRRLRSRSDAVVDAAIARARVAGALRGAAAAATGLATASVVAVGAWQHVPTSTIAAAITVLGLLAAPVHDFGRGVEYRQMYRAARRSISPALDPGPTRSGAATGALGAQQNDPRRQSEPSRWLPGGLHVRGLRLPDGTPVADLDAAPGARVAIELSHPHVTRILETIAGLGSPDDALVILDGQDIHDLRSRERRRRIGYAARGLPLEPGTLGRAIRYRTPDLAPAETQEAWAAFGLPSVIDRLPDGAKTNLRHGGEPLTVPERALVLLARAMLGQPQLLVLDNLDADLSPRGVEVLRRQIASFPGILLLASHRVRDITRPTHTWPPPQRDR